MYPSSGSSPVSVSQINRSTAVLTLVVIALATFMAASSHAASPTSDRRINVFFRYGIPPVSGNDYVSNVRVFNTAGNQFNEATTDKFGGIYRKGKVIVAHVTKDEKIISTDVSYQLIATGDSVMVKWSGKRGLSIRRTIHGHKARLSVAVVNVYNKTLPMQPK